MRCWKLAIFRGLKFLPGNRLLVEVGLTKVELVQDYLAKALLAEAEGDRLFGRGRAEWVLGRLLLSYSGN